MNTRRFLLILATILTPLALNAQELQKGIEGQKAPLINISTWHQLPEGKKELELTDYQGKVIVMLFFQHWCKASQERELPVLKNLVERYKGNDEIVFLAIQTAFEGFLDNTPDKLRVTAKKFALDIPLRSQHQGPRVSRHQRRLQTSWHSLVGHH